MNINKKIVVFFSLLLILSVVPMHVAIEAKNHNQRSSVVEATEAVEAAERYLTWEHVEVAQREIDSLGNGRPIRESKQDLQNRLDEVVTFLNENLFEEEEQVVSEDPVVEYSEEEEKDVLNEEQESAESVYHTVQAGDTLWLISLKYNVSVEQIKQLNDLQSDMIYVGQVILISQGEDKVIDEELDKDWMILGYYTKYWSTDIGSYQSLAAYHEQLNTIATASLDVNYDGTITGFIPTEALNFAKENNVKTYATFQNHFDPDLTRAIFSDEALQNKVINNMMKIVKDNGYNGINLNLENMYAADRPLFNRFVEKMTEVFHKEGYPVIVSVPAKTCDCPTWAWSGTFDLEFLGSSAVDYIQIMSYDQHGSWGIPGPVAGYEWQKQVLNYALNYIGAEKILLGLPGYGYDWNISNNSGHRAVTLKQIDTLIATHLPEIKWDNHEQTPYFHYRDANGDERVVHYDNFESLRIKTELVREYDLAGVSMWRMGQENEQFWLAVEEGLK